MKILVVGEAPGEQEDKQGRPFVGPSGQFLQDMIRRAGVNFSRDLMITNAIICRPPGNKMPKKGKEIGFCRPNLTKTIQEFKPRVVVTLGRAALESVIAPFWKGEIGNLERWVGFQIPLKDYWVCPTWHPSYILRETGNRKMLEMMFWKHLDSAFSIKDETPLLPVPHVEKLYEKSDIKDAINYFDDRGGFNGFDYETNGLKPEYPEAKIYSASISDGQRTVAFPWMPGVDKLVSRYLSSDRTYKLASNMKFEERWSLWMLGHGVTNWAHDSVLAAHVIDNRPGICSLKFQSFVLMGQPTYNEHIEPFLAAESGSLYNQIHRIPISDLLEYNGFDTFMEVHVARRQRKLMATLED
jgi:DNA polymerase